MNESRTPNGGIYVHVPFCARVCPYCDFAVTKHDADVAERYVTTLLREIAHSPQIGPVDTVYLGGGTPTALPDDALSTIVDAVRQHFNASGAVLHMEANPDDVTTERLARWQALHVRFLSLGTQSLDHDTLRRLGRTHSPADALKALELAVASGIETVSADVIFGLPDQDTETHRVDLMRLMETGVQHISCYQLTVHEGTPFAKQRERGQLIERSDDDQATFFEVTHQTLAEGGFEAYEVSNFARRGHRSRHNQKYWFHAPYKGLGPSAHSFLNGGRCWNERGLRAWRLAVEEHGHGVAGFETLDARARALEEVMLRLRTAEGVDLTGFLERHRFDLLRRNEDRIASMIREGWLRIDEGHLRPTLAGMAVIDGLVLELDVEPIGGEEPRALS